MTQSPDSTPPELPASGGVRPSGSARRARKRLLRRLGATPAVLRAIGRVGAGYMRLVAGTSRMTFDPPEPVIHYADRLPVIVTSWHGHHFLPTTFWPTKLYPLATLISLHRDGEVMAALAGGLGIDIIRGSGGRDPKRAIRSGGIRGFLKMKSALDSGVSVFMTADISKGISRRAGDGIIRLARATGRPILAIGVASTPEIRLENWDRSRIALPFGRTVCIMAPPIEVEREADDAEVEAKRQELEAALNAATARAYAALGRLDD